MRVSRVAEKLAPIIAQAAIAKTAYHALVFGGAASAAAKNGAKRIG